MHIFLGKNVFPPKLTELLRLCLHVTTDIIFSRSNTNSAAFS